jgi:hypothetical protein
MEICLHFTRIDVSLGLAVLDSCSQNDTVDANPFLPTPFAFRTTTRHPQ